MNHEAASEKLLDLAYGELSPREAREVAAHAEGCDACRGELARIRETRALMARLPEERPPEGGEAAVLAAARRAAEARKARPLLPPWLWAGTAGAMAAALVAVVSWQLTRSPAHEPFKAGAGELLARGAPAAPPPPAPAPPAPASVQQAARDEAARTGRPLGFLGGAAPAKRAESPKAARPEGAAAREEVVRSSGTFDANAGPAAGSSAGGIGAAEGAGWRRVEAERAPAPAAAPPAVAAAPEPAPAPAQKARAMAPAERKMAAPAARADAARERYDEAGAPERGRAAALRAEAAAWVPPGSVETRSFDGCAGERARAVQRDAEGRLVLYVRFLADSRRIEQRYGPDGRLTDAWQAEGKVARPVPLDTPWLVRDARDAAIDAPPRCQIP